VNVRIERWGDSAVTVEFEERIDPEVSARVVALAEAIERLAVGGVRDVVPTFRSVTVYFDPLKTDQAGLMKQLETEAGNLVTVTSTPLRVLRIPVCYGGEYGPDLQVVAAFAGTDESEVVALHARTTYRVFMLGFMPGFAYMASVDPRIAIPRRASPRVSVPAGSVAIGAAQTGIYPSDGPGGWHLVGKTPLKPYDPGRRDPFLLKAGDAVQFYSIEAADYERAALAVTLRD
jgi:inhibitor of KinA